MGMNEQSLFKVSKLHKACHLTLSQNVIELRKFTKVFQNAKALKKFFSVA